MSRHTKKKGRFGRADLSVAGRYLPPPSRRGVVLAGVGLAVAIVLLLVADIELGGGVWVSNGPLSSAHAPVEQSCDSCHKERAVSSDACNACHEKYGDELGVYSFASHQLYRTVDFRRVVPADDEPACFACHTEHRGREAEITRVASTTCLECHEVGSFATDHPDFDVVVKQSAERSGLAFSHIRHVREVMDDRGITEVERACLTCHQPERDGKLFQPIDFDLHCDACHLTTSVATPRLPIVSDELPGVETLAMIRESGRPGTEWSLFTNPAEFREAGPRVMKTPLHHEDPWVLDNLRRLRSELYRDTGLADLLTASPDAAEDDVRRLYDEAIDELERYAEGLRGRPEPEIQAELIRIEAILDDVRLRLRDPFAPLDETRFALSLDAPRDDVPPDRVAAVDELIGQLTEPCRTCHTVERATFSRVQTRQRELGRAEFDHRSHILETGCLDCHTAIPIAEHLDGELPPKEELDSSGIVNLPGIDTCRSCHNAKVSSQSCVTCHLYHPSPDRRSKLLPTPREAG